MCASLVTDSIKVSYKFLTLMCPSFNQPAFSVYQL